MEEHNKAGSSRKKTIAAFMQKTGCTKETAENYLRAARKNRGIVSVYNTVLHESDKGFDEDFDEDTIEDTGEDLSRDAGGAYSPILWDSSWGSAVRRAHRRLGHWSQILLERHMRNRSSCTSTVKPGARATSRSSWLVSPAHWFRMHSVDISLWTRMTRISIPHSAGPMPGESSTRQ